MRSFETALAALVFTGALGSAACGPDYDRTQIEGIVSSPLGGSIDRTRVVVPVGMIVKARIRPYNDDDEVMSGTLQVRDPSIMEVVDVVSDHDYAFLGLRPGVTAIELRADGKVVLILDAIVQEQPAPAP